MARECAKKEEVPSRNSRQYPSSPSSPKPKRLDLKVNLQERMERRDRRTGLGSSRRWKHLLR